MHRPWRRKADALVDRLDPDSRPAMTFVFTCNRHAGVAEPLDETAKQVLLIDGLIGADTVQLGGPVGGHHDDRHTRHARFDDRGQVVCGCGS